MPGRSALVGLVEADDVSTRVGNVEAASPWVGVGLGGDPPAGIPNDGLRLVEPVGVQEQKGSDGVLGTLVPGWADLAERVEPDLWRRGVAGGVGWPRRYTQSSPARPRQQKVVRSIVLSVNPSSLSPFDVAKTCSRKPATESSPMPITS